jgi:hypothetical protein
MLLGLKPGHTCDPITSLSDVHSLTRRWHTPFLTTEGEGAFGQVRKAELKVQTPGQGLVRVVVAAKMARAYGLSGNPITEVDKDDAHINLIQEAVLMAQFSHPNVIGLIGVCTRHGARFWTGLQLPLL